MTPRTLALTAGRLSLDAEGLSGDVYVMAVDVEVPVAAVYVVRSQSPSTHRMLLDGTLLHERPDVRAARLDRRRAGRPARARRPPTDGRAPQGGAHRLARLHRLARRRAALRRALLRREGAGAALERGEVEAAPASSPTRPPSRQRWSPRRDARSRPTSRRGTPRDATWTALDELLSELGELPAAAAWNVLSADLALRDRSLPTKVGQGRATRDLEVAVGRDPSNVGALLARGLLAVSDQRVDQAVGLAARARAARSPVGTPVLSLEARIALAQGVDAQADSLARQSLDQIDGLCEALLVRYDVARRRDAVTTTDGLLDAISSCPGEQLRRVSHWKFRGKLDRALAEMRGVRARQPGDVSLGTQEADVLVALKRTDEAAALLRSLTVLRPRDPSLWKRLGDTLALGKHDAEALAAREQALALDGSDLSLRRTVERSRTGKEILADYAIDGREGAEGLRRAGKQRRGLERAGVDAAATAGLRRRLDGGPRPHRGEGARPERDRARGGGPGPPGRAGAGAADAEGGRDGARA